MQSPEGGRARILHVLSGCTVGGAEMHVLSLLNGLLATGRYSLDVAYFVERPDAAAPLAEQFRQMGVQTHDLGAAGRFDLGAARRLVQLARRGYALVHTHSYRGDMVVGLARLAFRRSPPVVSTVHNQERIYLRPLASWGARLAHRGQYRVIAISDAVREFLLTHAGFEPEKVLRIHYGLDVEHYLAEQRGPSDLRSELGLPASAKIITILARLVPQKGHEYAILALPKLLESEPDACLVLVGHEDKDYSRRARKLVDQCGLTGRVTFCGFRDDPVSVLRQSNVLLLPSLWEGFGLVLLEAMACRCPVVATRVGAIPEIVAHGRTGLLIPPADPEAIASALRTILADPSVGRAFSDRALTELRRRFSRRAMVESIDRLYQGVLADTAVEHNGETRCVASGRP